MLGNSIREIGIKLEKSESTIKASKVLFVLFLVNYGWLQQALVYIPRLSMILLMGLMLTLTIDIITNKSIIYKLIPTEIYFWVVFLIYSVISGVFIAEDKESVIRFAKLFSKYIMIIVYMLYVSFRDGNIRFIINSINILTIIEILSAIINPHYVFGRLTLGSGNNANQLANFLLLGLVSFFITLEIFKVKKYRYLIFLCIAISGFLILKTSSRQGFVGLVIIFFYWIVFVEIRKIKNKRKINYAIFGLIILALIFGSITSQSLIFQRLLSTVVEKNTAGREQLFLEALNVFLSHPWIGVGIDNFYIYSIFKQYSHNTIIEALATTGVIGTTIYVGGLFFIFKNAWRNFRKIEYLNQKNYVDTLIFGSSILYLALSITIIHFYEMSSTLLIGLIIANNHIAKYSGLSKLIKEDVE